MAGDFQPYRVYEDDSDPDAAYDRGRETDVVELPVSWVRDDYPGMAFSPDRAFADEAGVVRRWRRGFDWMAANEPDGVFVLTMHPQVMGDGSRPPGRTTSRPRRAHARGGRRAPHLWSGRRGGVGGGVTRYRRP